MSDMQRTTTVNQCSIPTNPSSEPLIVYECHAK